jgi:hypothetical protein
MFLVVPYRIYVMITSQIFSACVRQLHCKKFEPHPAMFSRCFRQFPGPLAPSAYPSLVTINGRGKDRSPKRLADDFQDLWYDDLVQAQAIRASFLLESNAGFDRCLLCSSFFDCELTKMASSLLSSLLE